jgi:hypothetical protein
MLAVMTAVILGAGTAVFKLFSRDAAERI